MRGKQDRVLVGASDTRYVGPILPEVQQQFGQHMSVWCATITQGLSKLMARLRVDRVDPSRCSDLSDRFVLSICPEPLSTKVPRPLSSRGGLP